MNILADRNAIEPLTQKEYQLFWQENNGCAFLDANWLNLVKTPNDRITFYGLFKNGVVSNAFPVLTRKGRFIQTITLPSFTPFLGWILPGNNAELRSFVSKLKNSAIFYAFPTQSDMPSTLITYQLNLTQSAEELQKNLRSDKKRNIKKALTQNLKVKIESDYMLISSLIKQTFERQKHTFNAYTALKNIIESYPNHFQINIWDNTNCLASLLIVFDSKVAYYVIGGFDHKLNDYNAGPFAMWNAILKSKEMQLELFDFEGSIIPSIAQYFKSFGAKENKYSAFEIEKWYLKLIKMVAN